MDIKGVIKSKGYTLKQIADVMPNSRSKKQGITKGAFSQMVNGHVSLETLRTIAEIIGCKVGDFFYDEMSDNSPKIVCPHCGKELHVHIKIE